MKNKCIFILKDAFKRTEHAIFSKGDLSVNKVM